MRALAATLAAVLLAASLLAPRAVHAQRSGLLLGVDGDSGYRTLWIAPVDGRLALAVRRAGIVVPRPDGFWRVEVEHGCQVNWYHPFGEDSAKFVDRLDHVVRRRADAAPDTASDGCAEAERELAADTAAGLTDEGDVCGFDHVRLTHVSPTLVSWYGEAGSTEFCNPARYTRSPRREVWAFDGTWEYPEEPVTLMDELPPAEARRLARRFEAEKGDCSLQDTPDAAWGVERGVGHWRAAFSTNGAVACRGDSGGEVTMTATLPRTLARADDAARWLPALRARHGRVTDVLTATGGDLVVARVGGELLAYLPRNGALGEPALRLTLPADATVVMAEWATGAHVDRWTRELGALPR